MNRALLSLLLAGVLTQGCVRVTRTNYQSHSSQTNSHSRDNHATSPDLMMLEYHCRTGYATLENDRVQLIFKEVGSAERRAFHFASEQQLIQIAGPGTVSIRRSCRRNLALVEFQSKYANGTNTVQLGECSVSFADEGRLLLAGTEAIPLTNGQRIVHLTRKGVQVQ